MPTPPEPDPPRRIQQTEPAEAYHDIHASPEFAELRSRFRRLVLPLVAAFMAWYLLYVLTATYARDFMAEELVGRINVGLVFGVLQFASTFGIAYLYAKRAEHSIDPIAGRLQQRYDERVGGAQ